MIKAIETAYKGYKFRSRLEARWAVFFDTMGYTWKYENEGFERTICTENSGYLDRYLPDFELHFKNGSKAFVEVKGDALALHNEASKHNDRHMDGGILPGFHDNPEQRGLILLSDIPNLSSHTTYFHQIVQSWDGKSEIYKPWIILAPECPQVIRHRPRDVMYVLSGLSAPKQGSLDDDFWKIETHSCVMPRFYSETITAYTKARQARFEHGQTP